VAQSFSTAINHDDLNNLLGVILSEAVSGVAKDLPITRPYA